jgi:hypothetical protein
MTEPKKPENVADMLARGINPATGKSVNAPAETVAVSTPADLTAGVLANLQAPNASTDPVNQLLQLLFLREARELATLQKAENDKIQRDKKRALNNKDADSKVLLRQARCRHLKGATSTAKNPTVDYALSEHTFINADIYIRCLICGMRWKPADTIDFLVRNGKRISNHTKIGWREARNMMGQSTNTRTSTEIPFDSLFKAQAEGKYVANADVYGQTVAPKIVDEHGNEVESVEV